MNSESWSDFWRNHGSRKQVADEQTQVLRTSNGQPISQELWRFTLQEIDRVFPVGNDDEVLDLCCGNGLFAAHFGMRCKRVQAVDVSPDLLEAVKRRNMPNVSALCMDVRDAQFEDASFSRIFLYAGIQYFDYRETVLLFRKVSRWLRPGGLLFVGDIPDLAKLWHFYNTPERQALYFDNVVAGRDVVGTWFGGNWLCCLAQASGFPRAEVLPQHPDLIYAHFRFDLLVTR